MIGKRPDVLDGLSLHRRRQREADDMAFLLRQPFVRTSNPDDMNLIKQATGLDISEIPVATPDEPLIVVCIRVNLDHPLMLPDNVIGHCSDCDCDLQHRPDAPKASVHLCICCAARRQREQPE